MDGLTLTRVTPEATMRATTEDSDIEGEGEVEVGFNSFSQLIGRAGANLIKVEEIGDKLIIQSGSAKMSLLKTPPGTMPEPTEPDFECEAIELPIVDLLNYFKIVAGSASRDAADSALLGVCARAMFGGKLHFFATNRKSLHCVETPFSLPVDTLIPNEVVSAVQTAFEGLDTVATVSFHSNGLRVLTERAELFASVSEGKPPNVQGFLDMVYSAEVVNSMTMDRAALADALKAVAPVAAGSAKGVDLKLELGQVILEARNGKDAEITVSVDARTQGEGAIRFGADYLTGILAAASGEEVTIRNAGQAIYIRQDDRSFTLALMKAGQAE